jgi:hypothetical protein
MASLYSRRSRGPILAPVAVTPDGTQTNPPSSLISRTAAVMRNAEYLGDFGSPGHRRIQPRPRKRLEAGQVGKPTLEQRASAKFTAEREDVRALIIEVETPAAAEQTASRGARS